MYLVSEVVLEVVASLDQTLTSEPELFICLWDTVGEDGQLFGVLLAVRSKEVLEIALQKE